ncbi:hypothetical protein HDU96_005440 [Phlyctochytrium bullatum]|nr:hypothetical protein HDU96_005440 [Phlyctochytrium bullatum]
MMLAAAAGASRTTSATCCSRSRLSQQLRLHGSPPPSPTASSAPMGWGRPSSISSIACRPISSASSPSTPATTTTTSSSSSPLTAITARMATTTTSSTGSPLSPVPPTPLTTTASSSSHAIVRTLLASLATTLSRDDALHDLRWMIDRLLQSHTSSAPAVTRRRLIDRLHAASSPSQRVDAMAEAVAALLPSEVSRLHAWVKDRAERHKPLQYILGTQPFAGLEIAVRPPTLIPRWETEEWTMRLVHLLQRRRSHFNTDLRSPNPVHRSTPTPTSVPSPHVGRLRILDLCTGSGCIALALAHHLGQPASSSTAAYHPLAAAAAQTPAPAPTDEDALVQAGAIPCDIVGVDVSKRTLQLARLNHRRLQPQLPSTSNVYFFERDLLQDPFPASPPAGASGVPRRTWADLGLGTCLRQPVRFDVIVSNPPYVPAADHATLDASVRDWEDPRALVAGTDAAAEDVADGTRFHARILEMAGELLETRWEVPADVPRVVMEVAGEEEGRQAEKVERLAREAGFGRVERWRDLAGRVRAVAAFEFGGKKV